MEEFYKEAVRNIVNGSTGPEVANSDFESLLDFPQDDVIRALEHIFVESKESFEKSRVLDALSRLPGYDFVAFLVNQFDSANSRWQEAICRELGELKDQRAISKLTEVMLNHPEPDLRFIAVEQIEKIGNTEVISGLQNVVDNDTGEDFEGFPISDRANQAIESIRQRSR
ncbi:HEAT repeat protein [Deinobacterium chartae]|uniref:HEAT repeat protein n=1 Tax=Deinobacterium chartae TaxID=521158 RepID=A0A841I2Y6_9DEIO|nr:HEAT repeat domain-containing protein [Deinobacterium chartae]MBB6100037.1 HEAT repeat protein [Deinobacterium chartae]